MGMESRYLAAVSEHEQRRRQALEREHVRTKRLTEFRPRSALLSATVLSAKRKELNSIGDLVHITAREAVSERELDVVPEGDWSPSTLRADAVPSKPLQSCDSSDEPGASRPPGFFAGSVPATRSQATTAPTRGCCASAAGVCSNPRQRAAMQQRCTRALCSGWLDSVEPLPARAPLGVLARRADYFAPRWIPESEALDQADMAEWAAATIVSLQHSGDTSCAWIAKAQDWLCPPRKPHVNWFQVHVSAPLDRLVRSKLFVVLVTACIFANTVTLAIEHHGMSASLAAVLNRCNIVFTLVFLVEMVLKLMGIGPYRYFLDAFNIFDFVVVMISMGELASGQEGQGTLSAFRLARVFRVARLVRHWDEMRKILQVIAGSLTSFGYLALLLLLFLFVFSLLGMHLLGPAYADLPEADRPRNSFHTLHAAFLTCFQVLSGEGWNEVMEEAVLITGNKAVAVYFIAWVVVGSFVLLNLFLAVLLDGFASDDSEEQARAVEDVEAAAQELLRVRRATSALRSALNKSVREKTLFSSERQAMRESQRHLLSRKKAALFGASVTQRAASKTHSTARQSCMARSVSFSGPAQLPDAAGPAKPTLPKIRPPSAATSPVSTQRQQMAQVLDAWLPKRGQRTWAGRLAKERRASAVGFDDSVLDSCLRGAVSRTPSRPTSAGAIAAPSPSSHHSAATPLSYSSARLPPPPPPPQTAPPTDPPMQPAAASRAEHPSGPSRQASQRTAELLDTATAAPEPIRLTLAPKQIQPPPATPASPPRRPLMLTISPMPTRPGAGASAGDAATAAGAAVTPSASATARPKAEPLLDMHASSSGSSSTPTCRTPSFEQESDAFPGPSRSSATQANEAADTLRPLPSSRAESTGWVANPHTTDSRAGDAACFQTAASEAVLRRAALADGQAARMNLALHLGPKRPMQYAKSAEEAHPRGLVQRPRLTAADEQLEADDKQPGSAPGCISCQWQPRPAGSSGRSCGWFVRGSAAHRAIAKFVNPNTVLLRVPYPTTLLHLLTSCCLRGLGHDTRWVIASEQSHRNAALRQVDAQRPGCCSCCRGLEKSTAVPQRPKQLKRQASSAAEHPLQYLSITFDGIVLLCIFVSSALLALNEPGLDPDSARAHALFIAELVFTSIFVLEMMLRILAAGLMRPHQAYLRSWWNVLDCGVVLISIVGLTASSQFGAVRTLRLLRSLRPLRLIKRSSGMKVVVEALLKSVPAIVNVMGVLLMIFFVFGIMGTQLFSGTFSYCNDPAFPPGALLAGERTPDGQAWAVLPCDSSVQYFDPESNATVSRAVVRPALNFDHIGASMLTLFVASTGEDWPGAMWSTEDVTGPGRAPRRGASPALAYYWVLFMCFGVFFASELFVGVMLDSFSRLKRSMDGFGLLTARQREWVEAQRLLADARPEAVRAAPGSKWRKWLFKMLRRKPVQLFFVSCVVLNIVFMASSWFGQPLAWSRVRESVLLAFALMFLLEAALKIMAMGFWRYWADPWNRMDFVLSALGVLDVALLVESSNAGLQSFQRIIRVARSLRILRVVRAMRGVRVLLNTLYITLPSLLNVGALLLLLFYVYAVLGMATFGQVQRVGDIDTHANYSTWPAAMLLLFRMCTGEGWDGIMFSAMEDPTVSSTALVVYHVSFQVAASLVGLNLGVMIVLDGFEAADRNAESSTEMHVRIFKREWARLDPAGTRWISVAALELLLRELPPPLGVPKRCSFVELLRFAQRLDITTWDGYVNFREVLLAVHRIAYGVAIPKEILNAIDTAPRRLHRRIRRAIITKQRKSRLTVALRSTARLQLQKSVGLLSRAKSADAAKLQQRSSSSRLRSSNSQPQRSTLRTPPRRPASRAPTASQESSQRAASSNLSPRSGGMADAVQSMMRTRSGLASAMLGKSPNSGLDARSLDELQAWVIPGCVSVIDGTAERYLQVQTQRAHKFTGSVRQSKFADELCLDKIRDLVVAWRVRARARLAAQRVATGAAQWRRLQTAAKSGSM